MLSSNAHAVNNSDIPLVESDDSIYGSNQENSHIGRSQSTTKNTSHPNSSDSPIICSQDQKPVKLNPRVKISAMEEVQFLSEKFTTSPKLDKKVSKKKTFKEIMKSKRQNCTKSC